MMEAVYLVNDDRINQVLNPPKIFSAYYRKENDMPPISNTWCHLTECDVDDSFMLSRRHVPRSATGKTCTGTCTPAVSEG